MHQFGLWTAATGVLPYIGAWLGAIPAVIIGLFISPLTALLTAGAYLVINQIEGNILTPRIQGEAVKVHPLIVFLAVIAGGEIAGLLGAALAVPILAVLRVLVAFFAVRLYVRRPIPVAALPPTAAAPEIGGVPVTEAVPVTEPTPPTGPATARGADLSPRGVRPEPRPRAHPGPDDG